jgi:adenosine deaminase
MLELAEAAGHTLPVTDDAAALGDWFFDAANSGSLPTYLETFDHTIACMQTADALARVAKEAVLDNAADGVVYTEQRWAPEQHVTAGLSLEAALEAVQAGLEQGMAEAASNGHTIVAKQIITAMRHADRWQDLANLAVAYRDIIAGFDIAGAEAGFMPDRHPDIWPYLASNDVPVTIHAGEAAGVDSIAQAVHLGQAERIGHGVRIIDDIATSRDVGASVARLGRTAAWVRDHQIALEVAPVSNLQTGASPATTIADHPITRLKELDFAVTLNTDNRLMSRTSMTNEMRLLVDQAGWTIDDLLDVTVTAAWSAFIHHDERLALVENVIYPGFEKAEGAVL